MIGERETAMKPLDEIINLGLRETSRFEIEEYNGHPSFTIWKDVYSFLESNGEYDEGLSERIQGTSKKAVDRWLRTCWTGLYGEGEPFGVAGPYEEIHVSYFEPYYWEGPPAIYAEHEEHGDCLIIDYRYVFRCNGELSLLNYTRSDLSCSCGDNAAYIEGSSDASDCAGLPGLGPVLFEIEDIDRMKALREKWEKHLGSLEPLPGFPKSEPTYTHALVKCDESYFCNKCLTEVRVF